jgi:hypothetical protein
MQQTDGEVNAGSETETLMVRVKVPVYNMLRDCRVLLEHMISGVVMQTGILCLRSSLWRFKLATLYSCLAH